MDVISMTKSKFAAKYWFVLKAILMLNVRRVLDAISIK
jgi:hypothetical protein